jgi:hypothetical protein
MAMTVPEAFNAHDIGWFAEGSRTTSSSKRQAGRAVKERQRASSDMAAGVSRSRRPPRDQRLSHPLDDVAVEQDTFTGTHNGVLPQPATRHPSHRPLHREGAWR